MCVLLEGAERNVFSLIVCQNYGVFKTSKTTWPKHGKYCHLGDNYKCLCEEPQEGERAGGWLDSSQAMRTGVLVCFSGFQIFGDEMFQKITCVLSLCPRIRISEWYFSCLATVCACWDHVIYKALISHSRNQKTVQLKAKGSHCIGSRLKTALHLLLLNWISFVWWLYPAVN